MTHPHVEPPPIPLIQETHDGKSDRYFVNLKFRRDLTSSTSELYELKMSLFDNGDPEEFLFFMRNFNTTLTTLGMLEAGAKNQYLCTLVRREALRQFKSFSADVESMILCHVTYEPLVVWLVCHSMFLLHNTSYN